MTMIENSLILNNQLQQSIFVFRLCATWIRDDDIFVIEYGNKARVRCLVQVTQP